MPARCGYGARRLSLIGPCHRCEPQRTAFSTAVYSSSRRCGRAPSADRATCRHIDHRDAVTRRAAPRAQPAVAWAGVRVQPKEPAIRHVAYQRLANLLCVVTCAVASLCVVTPRSAGATGATGATGASEGTVRRPSTASREWGLAFGVGVPGLLEPGLGTGVGLSVQVGPRGRSMGWQLSTGLDLSWLASGGDTENWRVDHDEARLQGHVDARLTRGKGAWLVRAGLGATVVHERRVRHQSARLGSGAITASGTAVLPIASLALGAQLQIAGPISFAVRAGPTCHLSGRALRPGWTATLEALWTR